MGIENKLQVSSITITFADGTVTEVDMNTTAWVTTMDLLGYDLVGTASVNEDVILNYAYDLVDELEGRRMMREVEEEKQEILNQEQSEME